MQPVFNNGVVEVCQGEYQSFLLSKTAPPTLSGKDVSLIDVHPMLFPFQRQLTQWALRKGRCAIWADCGLGKTFIQLEWARLLGVPTLIVAPLAVAQQTRYEACKLGIEIGYARAQEDAQDNLTITNYEMVDAFDPMLFGAVVLDESSILKNFEGKTRSKLIQMFQGVPYRLCCTATPAPNDITEIANHAEFLGMMTRAEMLAAFFVHDDEGWRLKGHAHDAFYRWLASWGMMLKTPSDIGFSDDGYQLPILSVSPLWVDGNAQDVAQASGRLFLTTLQGIEGRSAARRATIGAKVEAAVSLVLNSFHDDEATTGRIHAGIPARTSGQVEAYTGAASEGQCQTARIVRSRPPAARKDTNTSEGLASSESNSEEDSEIADLRPDLSRIRSVDGISKELLRDMRIQRLSGQEFLSGDRSRPPNETGTWPALHELQSRPREVQGQSGLPVEGYSLPKWVIWCGLNAEQDALAKAFGNLCVSVYGSLSRDEKERRERLWREGNVPIIVTKPSVLGWGMNWQHCSRMAFVGLNDSYETYYQCIRRCWRFGQERPVNVTVVLSDLERPILENVLSKEESDQDLSRNMVANVVEYERAELDLLNVHHNSYQTDQIETPEYTLMLGDCVERMREISDDSVDFSVFSPPFLSLYTYSDSDRDMGNSQDEATFFRHFSFMLTELYRITKRGRIAAVHVAQVAAKLASDGYIGLKDFRGQVVAATTNAGFHYHGDITVDKNPQAQAIRTHAKGLLFKQLKKDASWLRPGLADYILVFRKPGESAISITPRISNDDWIQWAHPVWYGIRETRTLNATSATTAKDERHICPLQLDVIERCIRLWSNEGETIFSPFAGIGSEGYEAIRLGRRFIGIELKPSYFQVAKRNLEAATLQATQQRLL